MPNDIDAIIKAGFKFVINNRPDGENPGQPGFDDLAHILEVNGLEVSNIPMSPGQLPAELLEQTTNALDNLPKPILAYCASGTRSTILWCCAKVKEKGVEPVLSSASKAGYDLEQIRPLLNQLSL